MGAPLYVTRGCAGAKAPPNSVAVATKPSASTLSSAENSMRMYGPVVTMVGGILVPEKFPSDEPFAPYNFTKS